MDELALTNSINSHKEQVRYSVYYLFEIKCKIYLIFSISLAVSDRLGRLVFKLQNQNNNYMIVYDINKKLYLYYDSKIGQILCLNLQLVVVETALLGDGENVDLLELRTNLKELIKLTEGKYILYILLASFY